MVFYLPRHLHFQSHYYSPSQRPYSTIFFIPLVHFKMATCAVLLWLIVAGKKMFLRYRSMGELDVSSYTWPTPVVSCDKQKIKGNIQ